MYLIILSKNLNGTIHYESNSFSQKEKDKSLNHTLIVLSLL